MATKKPAAIIFIFVTVLIDVTGFGLIIPVFPRLIRELTHESLSAASQYGGWLLFAYSFVQFLSAPIVGGLSDRFGRKPVLLGSLAGFTADYVFLSFAPSIGWLFVGRVIAGIMGASYSTGYAYIADISEPEKRAANFGLIGVAFGLGFIIGPFLGGVLGQFGSRIPFFAAAGISFVNFLFGLFVLPESLKKENRRPFQVRDTNPLAAIANLRQYPLIAGMFVSFFFVCVASHAVQSTWTFYTIERYQWSEATIGISLAVVGFLFALVQGWLIRIVIPRFGQEKTLYLGLAMYGAGSILLGLASRSWMAFAFLIPYCAGGFTMPALQGLMSSRVPPDSQGELQGALSSLLSVTSIVGPPLMTNLFAYSIRPETSFYLPGAPMFLGAFLCMISVYIAIRTLHPEVTRTAIENVSSPQKFPD